MEDEKMMILTMLEQGKISLDEASKLIEVLDEAEAKELEENGFFSKLKEEAISKSRTGTKNNIRNDKSQNWESNFEERMENLGKKIESKFDKDFVKKIEIKGEQFGEKMGRLGENIAESTSSLTDKILDMVENVVDKGNFVNFFGSHETIAEKHEKDISNMDKPELVFQGVNGKILLKTWEEDKIHVDAICQIRKKDLNLNTPIYTIYEDGNKVVFKPSFTRHLGTKLEIKIPEKEYEKIHLMTTNGRIQASDLSLKHLVCNTSNSTVSLSDVESPQIDVDTKNGKILLKDVKSTNLILNTSNSTIQLTEVESNDIKATTRNAKIILEDVVADSVLAKTSNSPINITDSKARVFDTETTNGKINIYNIDTQSISNLYMKTSNSSIEASFMNLDKPFSIDTKTSMGKITVNIPNLVYDVNDQKDLGTKKIVAHSAEYNEENGVKVIALTSNGSIQIG